MTQQHKKASKWTRYKYMRHSMFPPLTHHHMFIPIEEHDGHGIIQLIHGVEFGYFGDVDEIDDGEILHIFSHGIENLNRKEEGGPR